MIKINPSKTASFDVDCQKGFTPLCPMELPVPGGHEIVPELNEQSLFADYRVGSKDAHPPNAYWNLVHGRSPADPIDSLPYWKKHIDRFNVKTFDNIDLYWPSHCVVGTSGFDQLDGLPHITEYDFFVYKGIEKEMHPYSAVYHDLTGKLSTGVIEWARAKGIETFILGGLALNYCVIFTAIHLKNAGFNVIVNLPATRSIGKPVEEVVSEFEPKGIIFINSLNELELNEKTAEVGS